MIRSIFSKILLAVAEEMAHQLKALLLDRIQFWFPAPTRGSTNACNSRSRWPGTLFCHLQALHSWPHTHTQTPSWMRIIKIVKHISLAVETKEGRDGVGGYQLGDYYSFTGNGLDWGGIPLEVEVNRGIQGYSWAVLYDVKHAELLGKI